jgi:hypothetical protein
VLELNEDKIKVIASAFRSRIISYRLETDNHPVDIDGYMDEHRENVISLITKTLKQHFIIRINIELFGNYVLPEKDEKDTKSFNTRFQTIDSATDVHHIYQEFIDIIKKKASDFQVS